MPTTDQLAELKRWRYPFYSLGDAPERIGDEVRLMIHPYLQNENTGYVNNPTNPDYEEKRDTLVRETPELIIIRIGERHILQPLAWLKQLQPKGPRAVYITNDANPFPLGIKRNFFARRLKSTIGTDLLTLCGAELVYDGYDLRRKMGCVNVMYHFLKSQFKIRIDREHSWAIQEQKMPFLPGLQV